MATFGVKVETSFSTDKTKINFSNFYKAFSSNDIKMKNPVEIAGNDSIDLDLTDSQFILLHADTYGIDNEVLNITLTSSTESITINNVSFLFLNCFNLDQITIENTYEDAIEIIAVY